jgi:hypothetical protein
MSILRLSLRARTLGNVLLIAFVVQLAAPSVQAAVGDGDEGRIANARWRVEGNVVVITYDLIADANLEYEIKVVLRRQSDPRFQFVPRSLSGAVGKGKFVGTNRVIRWDYRKDVPQGFSGDDYLFELAAYPQQPGSSVWWYGGLLAAGGVAAYFIFRPGTSPPPPAVTSTLPEPPKSWPPGQ